MPHRPRPSADSSNGNNRDALDWKDYIKSHNLRDQLRERNWSKNQRKHIKQVYFAAHPEELRKKRRRKGAKLRKQRAEAQLAGLKTPSERRRFIKRHPEQFSASQF